MASFVTKTIVGCLGLAVAFAVAPADAEARKHRKPAAHHTEVAAKRGERGTNLFPAGPVYHAGDYLGDDPDPNIRFQLLRDLGIRYGGEP
jgi:hypothetical protein